MLLSRAPPVTYVASGVTMTLPRSWREWMLGRGIQIHFKDYVYEARCILNVYT